MVGNVQKGTQYHWMIRGPESTYLQCGFMIDKKRRISTVVIQKTADFYRDCQRPMKRKSGQMRLSAC